MQLKRSNSKIKLSKDCRYFDKYQSQKKVRKVGVEKILDKYKREKTGIEVKRVANQNKLDSLSNQQEN